MRYQKGDRVRHPTMEDWGLGEVLEDSAAGTVRVFFVGAGEKILSLAHVEPIKVAPEVAAHPVLDNLKIKKTSSGIRYQSLPESIAYFLEQFPEGFYGERFERHERDYKVHANEQAKKLLSEPELRSLIEGEDYKEVARRALKVMNATNLIFPNEKMALKDGLEDEDATRAFAIALLNLLYGNADMEERLMGFARVLEELDAAKWTTLTYFPFIVHPTEFMFVKPTITQHAAELCGFEINYRPQLNWLTYKQVLGLSKYLKAELAELNPRDMIDVQSFMWCIAPGKYHSAGD
jgi:hypothetical protein